LEETKFGWKWEVLVCPVSSLVKRDVVKRRIWKNINKGADEYSNMQDTNVHTSGSTHSVGIVGE